MTLAHYTLNTGHLRASPRAEVAEATIRHLDPLIRHRGGYVPGFGGDLELGFSLAPARERCLIQIAVRETGRRKADPAFVLAALAWGEDAAGAAWESMRRIAAREGLPIVAQRPETLPLLIVLLTAQAARVAPDVLAAAADLERCIAWTILAREGIAH